MVSGAAKPQLWVFDCSVGILREIERDEGLMERIRQAWEAFQPFLDRDTPPPLSEADTATNNGIDDQKDKRVSV